MITVHHLEVSRAVRILWLLEELELPYTVKHYERNRATYRAPRELRALHPLGKSPIVSDGDRVLAESAVIIEDLIDRYGGGTWRPALGTPEYERYRYWLHYAEGSLMPNLVMKLIFSKIPQGAPALMKPLAKMFSKKVSRAVVDPEVALHLEFIERELAGQTWFAGNEPTGADVQMSFPLEQLSLRGDIVGPNVMAFVERMRLRPAYQRALVKAKA